VTGTAISVVVCAHDERRWQELEAAVRSVQRQTLRPREVIVVVDGNERLLERAQAGLPDAVVTANSATPGLGGARNSGIGAASGSIVAFLDDDAVATPEWLALLSDGYRDPAVAGVGGSIAPIWEQARPRWFPRECDWVVGCSYLGMPVIRQEVRNLHGCNMSFRREVLEQLGGFRLGYGCDETELCIRLRQRWPVKKLLYAPEAMVLHNVPHGRCCFRRFLARCYFEGGSKAVVSRLVGVGVGLSAEYRYTRAVLPRGVRQGIRDLVRRRDPSGLQRAAAIVAGLTSTAAGYVAGSVTTERAARRRGFESL